MIRLSPTEEQLMELLWTSGKLFLKDLIALYPDPKPATTTVATLLKRIQDKGYISYTVFGNSREYYPLITKEAYFSNQVNGMIEQYFNNSALQFASFFTNHAKLSKKELEKLRKIIDAQLHK